MTDDDIDAAALRGGAGVPHGELLVRLVDASFADDATLAAVRKDCVAALGTDATIDAAAVIANFHMMTRIADGTGTPIDDGTDRMSADLLPAIGIADLVSRRLDPTAPSVG